MKIPPKFKKIPLVNNNITSKILRFEIIAKNILLIKCLLKQKLKKNNSKFIPIILFI